MKHNPKVLSFSTMLILTSFFAAQKAAAADTTPDPFTFNPANGVPTNMVFGSNKVTITGIDTPAPISILGGTYSINNGPYVSDPGTINNNDTVALRVMSAPTYGNVKTSATLTIDTETGTFDVITDPIDLAPDQFAFTPVFDAVPGQVYESNPITVAGLEGITPIGVWAGGGQYSINGGEFVSTSGAVKNGDTVRVRMAAPADPNVLAYTNLSIHYIYSDFFIQSAGTTKANPFTFTEQTNVPLSTVVESNPITISGLVGEGAISVTGGAYSINGGPLRISPTNILNNDVITVTQTSSATPGATTAATLTISGTSSDFNVTTAADGTTDTTPEPFTFDPQTGVALSTQVTSNPITVTGIDSPSPISITNGEYSLDGGTTFTTDPGTVVSGDTVVVRLTSSNLPLTPTTATLTIGGVNGEFVVTTLDADVTPEPFTFDPQTGVALSTQVTSNPITVTGIDSPSPISITNGEYSLDGGTTFTTDPGTVVSGDTVVVRLTSSNLPLTPTTATLTIGGVNGEFVVTTLDADVTPEPFTFDPQTGVALSTVVESNPVTISGINAPTTITVTDGEYSIEGAPFTSADGTVTNGQTVVVRQTSSASFLTPTVATLVIGGVTGNFSVTTLAEVQVPPVIESIPDQNAILNQLFTFTVKATDANGDAIAFSLGSNAPAGMTIDSNSGVISWTPASTGTFTFDIIASDGTLSDIKPITIIVTETPVVVSREDENDDECDTKCEKYNEYRREFKSDEFKKQYYNVKALKNSNPAEFARLEAIYMQYKKLSGNEISELPKTVQTEFKLFKHYRGYKHYRDLKSDLNK